MLIEIGTIINKYQKQNEVNNGSQILLKTKEVIKSLLTKMKKLIKNMFRRNNI